MLHKHVCVNSDESWFIMVDPSNKPSIFDGESKATHGITGWGLLIWISHRCFKEKMIPKLCDSRSNQLLINSSIWEADSWSNRPVHLFGNQWRNECDLTTSLGKSTIPQTLISQNHAPKLENAAENQPFHYHSLWGGTGSTLEAASLEYISRIGHLEGHSLTFIDRYRS